MGKMGINLQLVDVIYPVSEGWEGPELASSPHCVLARTAQTRLLEELHIISVSFRGKQSLPRPQEKGAASTK